MTSIRVDQSKLLLSEISASDRTFERVERHAAERFEDLLELHERALARGLASLADYYADRIVDEMTVGLAR